MLRRGLPVAILSGDYNQINIVNIDYFVITINIVPTRLLLNIVENIAPKRLLLCLLWMLHQKWLLMWLLWILYQNNYCCDYCEYYKKTIAVVIIAYIIPKRLLLWLLRTLHPKRPHISYRNDATVNIKSKTAANLASITMSVKRALVTEKGPFDGHE